MTSQHEGSLYDIVFILYVNNKLIKGYKDMNRAVTAYREAQRYNPDVKLDSVEVLN